MSLIISNSDPVLDPVYARAEVERHFAQQLTIGRAMADYGAQLLKRAFVSCGRDKIEDLIVIAVLFRQALVAFDGCMLCIAGGAVEACNVHARTLLEVHLYIEWILREGKERWGRQFYVAGLRQERAWAQRVISGTADHTAFTAAWQATFERTWQVDANSVAGATATVNEVGRILALPKFAAIDRSFDAARGKRQFDQEWYKVGTGSPTSIRDMAEKLGKTAYYLVLYKSLSAHVHGTAGRSGLRPDGDGLITIEPVRAIAAIGAIYTTAVSIWLWTCRQIMAAYRPDELHGFAVTYSQEWQPHLTFPEIQEEVIPVRV